MATDNNTPAFHDAEARKAKQREATTRYRLAHPEKIAAAQAGQRKRWAEDADYRSEQIARTKARRAANPEAVKASADKSYEKHKERNQAASLVRYHADRARWQARSQAWKIANPDKVKAYSAAYSEANQVELRKKWAATYAANPEAKKIREAARYLADPGYQSRRYHNNPQVMIRVRLRARLAAAMKSVKAQKASPFWILIGCDAAALRRHIEDQFVEGMSWDNYSRWHIDHIRPCCTFELTDPAQQKLCFHFTNLRPLWKEENLARPRSRLWLCGLLELGQDRDVYDLVRKIKGQK